MWQTYLKYHERMGILPLKKRVNRDKCNFATKQRMFGVFTIDEILRYRWSPFTASHTFCQPGNIWSFYCSGLCHQIHKYRRMIHVKPKEPEAKCRHYKRFSFGKCAGKRGRPRGAKTQHSSTLIPIRSWVALSFKVCQSVSQSGIGNTCPHIHSVQYIKA